MGGDLLLEETSAAARGTSSPAGFEVSEGVVGAKAVERDAGEDEEQGGRVRRVHLLLLRAHEGECPGERRERHEERGGHPERGGACPTPDLVSPASRRYVFQRPIWGTIDRSNVLKSARPAVVFPQNALERDKSKAQTPVLQPADPPTKLLNKTASLVCLSRTLKWAPPCFKTTMMRTL